MKNDDFGTSGVYMQTRASSIKRNKMTMISGPAGASVFHSDRSRQKIFDVCKLCHQKKDLMLSHIAPKWAYQWMKREGGITAHINSEGIIGKVNDGVKHYLLCWDCEQLLGRKEEYLANLCKGTEANLRQIGVTLREGPILEGVRLEALKGSVLGVLYKAHFAPSSPWGRVTFPDSLMENIRTFLLEGTGDSVSDIHLAGNRWVSFRETGINPKSMISIHFIPGPVLISIQLLMGGCSWICFLPAAGAHIAAKDVANVLGDPEGEFELPVLEAGQAWKILHGEILDCYLVNKGVVPDDIENIPHFEDMDQCYCGMTDRGFETCCRDRWIQTEVNAEGRLIFSLML